jgi:hypothetical protein
MAKPLFAPVVSAIPSSQELQTSCPGEGSATVGLEEAEKDVQGVGILLETSLVVELTTARGKSLH